MSALSWFPRSRWHSFATCFGQYRLFCSDTTTLISSRRYSLFPRTTSFFLCSRLTCVESFPGEVSWFGTVFMSVPFCLYHFLSVLLLIPLQLHSNSTTRDVEQSTKGVFSGPLRGPLPLLADLSPNLEYMFVHRHACTKCCLQPRLSFVACKLRNLFYTTA